jgi:crotonobetainyl-CoA:carnitine CoA-transferase CaiB-like acyl-CoA transferase
MLDSAVRRSYCGRHTDHEFIYTKHNTNARRGHVAEAGLVALPNSAIHYDGIPAADADADPAPLLGEHMDEVLSELCGLDEADIAGRRNDGVI